MLRNVIERHIGLRRWRFLDAGGNKYRLGNLSWFRFLSDFPL
jgi:hypothetical protein